MDNNELNVQLKAYKRRTNLIFFLASFILSILITATFYFVYYSYRVVFVYADEALFNNFYMVLFIPSIFVSPAFVCYLMRLLYEKEKRYNYEYCIDYNCFIGCFLGLVMSSAANNIPKNVEQVVIVNTDDNSKTIMSSSDSKELVKLANGTRNYLEKPSCMGSNIELEFRSDSKSAVRQVSGDDCGTLWDEKGNSYSISDSNMKKIKRIIAGYNIQVCPQ